MKFHRSLSFQNTHFREEVNSTHILVPVSEFLLVNSAASQFFMATGLEGKFLLHFLYMMMRSLTIFGSAGI